jgi:hypothetical protein
MRKHGKATWATRRHEADEGICPFYVVWHLLAIYQGPTKTTPHSTPSFKDSRYVVQICRGGRLSISLLQTRHPTTTTPSHSFIATESFDIRYYLLLLGGVLSLPI